MEITVAEDVDVLLARLGTPPADDAVGNFDGKYFDTQWQNLQSQIVKHLDKADYVPVDVSKFTPEQIAKVKEFIGPLGPRVFTVGS
jgi:CdiA C-terminal tRNase domain